MRIKRAFALLAPLTVGAFATSLIPWEDLTEGDWLYALATRFALVDGHKVHYPTPTAELARLLEGRTDPGALRHLAEARLALGDRKGALETLERWAQAGGPEAWAETARWEAAHHEPAAAFAAAERALPGLGEEARRTLADERITWAEAHPDLADPIALLKARSALFPDDALALEAWLRALEKAGRLDEADQGLAASRALPPERSLLVRSDLKADHGDIRGAFQVLDGAVGGTWSAHFSQAYARRTDQAAATAPGAWRAALETRYDAGTFTRLFTYLLGRRDPGPATDLLRQVERRYEKTLQRQDELLLSRFYASVDAIPEAFRAALAAAHQGGEETRAGDLAELAQLALRAGGRPLAWGTYNDEANRWAAAVDRTPGFWTGGVSFLLTGLEWKEAQERLESNELPDRTFATARALEQTLARRAPKHPSLPALRVAIMARHVERGEGREALALLPQLEDAPPDQADEARRQALLAAHQTSLPQGEELRLMRARLRHAAPDGSKPTLDRNGYYGEPYLPADQDVRAWTRLAAAPPRNRYAQLLDECTARLDQVDGSHRASLDLILGELDRLPDAEALWLDLASRLEGWNLDDELGPRYLQALKRFQDPGIWDKAARWQARRGYHAELRQLAQEVTARFRGSALFQRAGAEVTVQVPEQPPVGAGVRMVLWADWVRLKALERFPHSPQVFREAGRLVTPATWEAQYKPAEEARKAATKVIVPAGLLEERRWAILFVDPAQREAFFGEAMAKGTLEAELLELEARADRTPVEDQLLFEGWARLSRFERALAPGERLCRSYPGDGALVGKVLSLHRSLNGLETSHAAPARALVERAAPALENPNALWTELGEMEEDRGQGGNAMVLWRNLLAREPRDPAKIAELATLLWDYNHDREALEVVEAGRKALARPRFYAFETGVLRENLKDLDGAVREYLDATRPEQSDGYESSFENDQRALRRLAQLLGRERVFAMVAARIKALAPGNAQDEKTLAAFWPLGTIQAPDPGLVWDADSWIDQMDHPVDPEGRAQRQAQKEANRPAQFSGIRRIGDLMLEKAREMAPQATATGFLDFTGSSLAGVMEERWPKTRTVDFKAALMARRAQLAPAEEERIRLEMERAAYLADNGRSQEADTVWAALAPRLDKLPEGTIRLKAESQRAGYVERSKGIPAAAEAWRHLTAKYPWSLGLLQDRLAFLDRAKLGEEARALLEETVPRAASGHRENLLEQLTRASLAASDTRRARKAVDQLLAREGLEDPRRLAAAHLLARLSFRENPAWDPFPLAKAQAALLKPETQADLYHELARAADLENVPTRGVALWIEALNRRTERPWLAAAARSTQRTGKGPELLAFFEKQRERSPRDMRWVVAVRDIKCFFHDVDGAIEAAKAAVAVRPEQEPLWREAADILVRADRIREAADFLEGWNRPRPAAEDVAQLRSELYVRAGDGAKALAIEQGALKALDREGSANRAEKQRRRARAAERLFSFGHPELAVRLYSAEGDVAALAQATAFDMRQRVRMALALGQFPRLLGSLGNDALALPNAGAMFNEYGRSDQREEVQAWLLRSLFPLRNPAPDAQALQKWWPFLTAAGLEPGLRAALAQRLVSSRPGPWQMDAPFPFLQATGDAFIALGENNRMVFREPDLPGLWVRDLARRDHAEELLAFLEPRWQELLTQARGEGQVASRQTWTSWLDDRAALAAWAQAAANHPEKVKELSELMGERHRWDRFWALGARGWSADILMGAVPEGTRAAWFRFWETQTQDPVLLARRGVVERVSNLMGRLVQGAPDSASDPLLDKLRGPRTVGEVLGKDPRWLWPEFTPRRNAKGEGLEKGDDAITGQGVDRGRVPGALWGERPGEAWYVLEALARYRKGDPTAPILPLEASQKGGETQRVLLAMAMARAMGNLPLAQRIEASRPGPPQDRGWLEGRLALLVAADRKQEAAEIFRTYVKGTQAALTETAFKDLTILASRLDLPAPMACLDSARPVGPVFLAYLQDQRPEAARTLQTANLDDYRTALQNRWSARTSLTKAQARYWLQELWATGSGRLPRNVLVPLGPVWPSARKWLDSFPIPERAGALVALDEALDPHRAAPALLAELSRPGSEDAYRLLALRIRLARNELEPALALLDAMLAESDSYHELSYDYFATPAPNPQENAEGEGEGDGEAQAPMYASSQLDDRMSTWLAPFRAAGKAGAAEERCLKILAQRRQDGTASTGEWKLAFRLTPIPAAAPLVRELDTAWFRGEVPANTLGEILSTAAPALGADLSRWLSRWPSNAHQTRQRVAILELAKHPAEALQVLLAARGRDAWPAKEEAQAFEVWRRLGAASTVKAPEYWTGAAAVWNGTIPLSDRLKAHPHDVLAARAALRVLGPQDENALARTALILETDRPWAPSLETDKEILRLRAARGLLARSPLAAANALGTPEAESLARLLASRAFKAADINAALADVARIAARLGQEARARATLGVLADRNAPNLKALQVELAPARGKADTFRMEGDKPVPIRPRDLTWALLTSVLKKEGVQ